MRRFAVTAIAVCWALAGCAATVDGTPVAGSPRPSTSKPARERLVPAAKLPGLLPDIGEIRKIMAAPAMNVKDTDTRPVTFPQMKQQPVECAGTVYAGMAQFLHGSGYRGFFAVEQAGASILPTVNESLAVFDDAAAARRYAAKVADQWRGCSGKQFLETNPKGEVFGWDVGVVVETGGVTALRTSVAANPGVAAVRMVAAKANVAVDLEVVGAGLGEQPKTIITRILARIPG